jgi:hypothetical protein
VTEAGGTVASGIDDCGVVVAAAAVDVVVDVVVTTALLSAPHATRSSTAPESAATSRRYIPDSPLKLTAK